MSIEYNIDTLVFYLFLAFVSGAIILFGIGAIGVIKSRSLPYFLLFIAVLFSLVEMLVGDEFMAWYGSVYLLLSLTVTIFFMFVFFVYIKRKIGAKFFLIGCVMLISMRLLFLVPFYYLAKSDFEYSVQERIDYPYDWSYCFWHRAKCWKARE